MPAAPISAAGLSNPNCQPGTTTGRRGRSRGAAAAAPLLAHTVAPVAATNTLQVPSWAEQARVAASTAAAEQNEQKQQQQENEPADGGGRVSRRRLDPNPAAAGAVEELSQAMKDASRLDSCLSRFLESEEATTDYFTILIMKV
jgi:hypothetical protein